MIAKLLAPTPSPPPADLSALPRAAGRAALLVLAVSRIPLFAPLLCAVLAGGARPLVAGPRVVMHVAARLARPFGPGSARANNKALVILLLLLLTSSGCCFDALGVFTSALPSGQPRRRTTELESTVVRGIAG